MRRSYLLLAALGAVLAALAFPSGSPSQTTTNTWAGTWNTTYGTMILEQNGSAVEGKYAFESGHVAGTVTDNVLNGRWDEAPRASAHDRGPFKFVMRPDGKAFDGTWGHDDTGPYPDPWNGTCTGGGCLQNGTAPTTDQTPPTFRGLTNGKTLKQDVLRQGGVVIKLKPSEDSSIDLNAMLELAERGCELVGGGACPQSVSAKVVRFKSRKGVFAPAGKTTRVKLKLPRKARKPIRIRLRNGRRLTVRGKIKATDAAGNTVTFRVKVRLKGTKKRR